jgi:acyl carrier protein
MQKDWDEAFEDILRDHLRFAGDDDILPNSDLRLLGLDSMGTIRLLVAIEELYEVDFPDDALMASVWSTPATLWRAITELAE